MKSFLIAAVLLVASSTQCQSISPVIQIGSHYKANISFDIGNDMLTPAVVVLEPTSMTPGPKGPSYRALDPDVHVEVSELSVKLGAKQHHTFRAKITCSQDCAVAIWATFMPPKTDDGAQVAIHFPETIYTCSVAKDCRKRILAAHGAL